MEIYFWCKYQILTLMMLMWQLMPLNFKKNALYLTKGPLLLESPLSFFPRVLSIVPNRLWLVEVILLFRCISYLIKLTMGTQCVICCVIMANVWISPGLSMACKHRLAFAMILPHYYSTPGWLPQSRPLTLPRESPICTCWRSPQLSRSRFCGHLYTKRGHLVTLYGV